MYFNILFCFRYIKPHIDSIKVTDGFLKYLLENKINQKLVNVPVTIKLSTVLLLNLCILSLTSLSTPK